jgi:hypothetical protein
VLTTKIDLGALFDAMSESLAKTIKPTFAKFFLIDEDAPQRFVAISSEDVNATITPDEQELLSVFLLGSASVPVFIESETAHFPRDAPPYGLPIAFFEDAARLAVTAIVPLVFRGSSKRTAAPSWRKAIWERVAVLLSICLFLSAPHETRAVFML